MNVGCYELDKKLALSEPMLSWWISLVSMAGSVKADVDKLVDFDGESR